MSGNYNADAIHKRTALEMVRESPNFFGIERTADGQAHLCKEIGDNAIDEIGRLKNGKLDFHFFFDPKSVRYRVVVVDNGRGVPIADNKLKDCFSEMFTSGKYGSEGYDSISSGQHGVGAKATAALSSFFRVISMRPKGTGNLFIREGVVHEHDVDMSSKNKQTGTIVIFEPDATMFHDLSEFRTIGYLKILKIISLISFFDGQSTFRMFEYDEKLPDLFWSAPRDTVLERIRQFENKKRNSLFDSSKQNENPSQAVGRILDKYNSTSWELLDVTSENNKDNDLYYKIFAVLPTTNTKRNQAHTSIVNYLPMSSNTCSHLVVFRKVITDLIAEHIDDKVIRTFCKENYKLPLDIVMSVKYPGAKMLGAGKDIFKDREFEDVFYKRLHAQLKSPAYAKQIEDLFDLLSDDIIKSFEQEHNVDTNKNGSKRMLLTLNYPTEFSGCSTKNSNEAELFLVEGSSAGGTAKQGRNPNFQAVYALRGKPLNGADTIDNIVVSRAALNKNPIMQDLIKIIGLSPNLDNVEDLNYGKVIIMADADSDGQHIQALMIGNLYLLCDKLIEHGRLYVSLPPLYAAKIKNKRFYIHDQPSLDDWMIEFLFAKYLDVHLQVENTSEILPIGNGRVSPAMCVFYRALLRYGEMVTQLENKLALPELVIEALLKVTYYLTPETMDVDIVKQKTGANDVFYDADKNALIYVTDDDIIIPLAGLVETFYETQVLSIYRNYGFHKSHPIVSTTKSPSLQNVHMTHFQLYRVMMQLARVVEIKRFKGLGTMEKDDFAMTCMHPDTRQCVQIDSIGDIKRIFDLLGSDSSARKELIDE